MLVFGRVVLLSSYASGAQAVDVSLFLSVFSFCPLSLAIVDCAEVALALTAVKNCGQEHAAAAVHSGTWERYGRYIAIDRSKADVGGSGLLFLSKRKQCGPICIYAVGEQQSVAAETGKCDFVREVHGMSLKYPTVTYRQTERVQFIGRRSLVRRSRRNVRNLRYGCPRGGAS